MNKERLNATLTELESQFCRGVINFLRAEQAPDGTIVKSDFVVKNNKITLTVTTGDCALERKHNKLQVALVSVPHKWVLLEPFAKKFDVSPNSLKQATRFDKTGLLGKVIVRKRKGADYIMREKLSKALAKITSPEIVMPMETQ